MDLDQLSQLNKEFAEQTQEMNGEFIDLFEKWKKKNFRLAIFNAIHLPINIILNIIERDKNSLMPKLFEDFPDVFERFLLPFVKIKDKWGKISSEKFAELYSKEYQKQFYPFFIDAETKENFKEWYEK